MNDDDRCCGTCRFWRPSDPIDGIGECHRNPPTPSVAQAVAIVLNLRDVCRAEGFTHDEDLYDPYSTTKKLGIATWQIGLQGVWPETIDVSWCGEYQPKDKDAEMKPPPTAP